jgi:hypothetical protein
MLLYNKILYHVWWRSVSILDYRSWLPWKTFTMRTVFFLHLKCSYQCGWCKFIFYYSVIFFPFFCNYCRSSFPSHLALIISSFIIGLKHFPDLKLFETFRNKSLSWQIDHYCQVVLYTRMWTVHANRPPSHFCSEFS